MSNHSTHKPTTIRRARKDWQHPYKPMRRATFEDNGLSLEARGLLAYILVKPDDWTVTPELLRKTLRVGRDRMYRMINELIECGYCERIAERGEGARMVKYHYFIHEEPPDDLMLSDSYVQPLPEKPEAAFPEAEKPEAYSIYITNKEEDTKEEGIQPKGVAPTLVGGTKEEILVPATKEEERVQPQGVPESEAGEPKAELLTPFPKTEEKYQVAWQNLLQELKLQMPSATYNTWVRQTQLMAVLQEAEHKVLVIGLPNKSAYDWMNNRLRFKVERVLRSLLAEPVAVSFQVQIH